MNERVFTNPSQEELANLKRQALEQEGEKLAKAYLAGQSQKEKEDSRPDANEIVLQLLQTKSSPEIMARLEELLVSFEENFSLDELSAINTEEEALASPLRKSALLALEPIISHLKVLEERKDTSPETYQRLEKIYRRFSRAIGFCNTYAPGGSRHD